MVATVKTSPSRTAAMTLDAQIAALLAEKKSLESKAAVDESIAALIGLAKTCTTMVAALKSGDVATAKALYDYNSDDSAFFPYVSVLRDNSRKAGFGSDPKPRAKS